MNTAGCRSIWARLFGKELVVCFGTTLLCFVAHGSEQQDHPTGTSVPPPQREPKPPASDTVKVRANLVNMDVTVSDSQGNFVSGLTRENFRVFDEGTEQPITHFAPVEAPAQVLVLLETSPAVYLIHQEHLAAAYALLEGLAPDDQVALASYSESPRLVMNFTSNKGAVAQAFDALHYNLGMPQLNLFESLSTMLDWLAPLPGKKAIVLLSTGLDSSAEGRWDNLVQKLHASDVVILPVALGGELRAPDQNNLSRKKKKAEAAPVADDTGPSFQKADRALESIAQATGAHAYFPRDARDFGRIYRQIAVLLRHQYSIGFPPALDSSSPGSKASNRFHRIEVKVVEAQAVQGRASAPAALRSGCRINARPGYLAPLP